MTTTPTLRDAAQALTNAEIDEVVYACRQAGDDSTYAIVREAVRRAALAAPADALAGPVAPAAWWIEKTEQFTLPSKDGSRPFDRNWQPLYTATQLAQAVERAMEPVKQAISDYHYALDTRQHGGLAQDRAITAISNALGVQWMSGVEAAIRRGKEGGHAEN